MSKTRQSLEFSLYEACPFESSPVVSPVEVVTTPEGISGAAHPEFMGVCSAFPPAPCSFDVRSGYCELDDFHGCLDAPSLVPYGGVRSGEVRFGDCVPPFVYGHALVLRPGAYR